MKKANTAGAAGPGNDVVTVDGNDTPGTFDGGGGTDTLVVFGDVDFTTSTLTSFERLAFTQGAFTFTDAIFSSDQLGSGLSNTLRVSGIDHTDSHNLSASIEVWAATPTASINIAGWTFENWSGALTISRGLVTRINDNITLNGDAGANMIIGSRVADYISGGSGGVDDLRGGAGNDALSGFTGGDQLNGGAGFDMAIYRNSTVRVLGAGTATGGDANGDVLTSIENVAGSAFKDILTGSNGVNELFGLAGDDTLNGGGGGDRIAGGDGHDKITGGAGADRFIYDVPPLAADSDTINDFAVGDDRIVLENNSAFDDLGTSTGRLAAAKFYVGAAAHDASDRIIYNSATGALLYDPDGTGSEAQVLIAKLGAGLALTNADVVVI